MSRRDISDTEQGATLPAYRTAAFAEADAHFDDRALEAQRHKILARLAHLGHPAKVIRFPKGYPTDAQTPSVNRRWLSVAAAAGLLMGVLGGELLHLLPPSEPSVPAAISRGAAPPAQARSGYVQASAPIDDGLLGEVELVMQARTANELRVLDELTLADQH
ncbi:MAG: hypothetical protein ACKOEC_05145 [Acidimicrobiia bacterium]